MEAPSGIWLARPETQSQGTPVAVKDLFDTAGLTTTYGSAIFADHVPTRTAAAVERLEAAGYAIAGKTNLHEFAFGVSSQNETFGTVPNPRYPGRLAGGSSGGSAAAVAAGDVDVALGSDSGGSIRIPAAWCGVVGFKPTYGLVPTEGCFPLAPTYDHAGPIAATVAGCIDLMRALAPEFAPVRCETLAEVRVGVAWLEDADPLVRSRVEAAATHFPRRSAIELPLPPRDEYALFMREVADVHRAIYPDNADAYGASVRWKLERCFEVTGAEAERAAILREEYRARCTEALADVDILVTPTVELVAPPADADERVLRRRATRLTYPFDSLGFPALALPCGPAEDGLAASVQLVGHPGDDARVLAVGGRLASLI